MQARVNAEQTKTVYYQYGSKTLQKSLIYKGFWGVPLKENLCIFNTEKELDSPEGKEEFLMYEIRRVRDHIEVFLNGEFQFSADNMKEVYEELDGSI